MQEDFMSRMPSQALDAELNDLTQNIILGCEDVLKSLKTNTAPDLLLRQLLGLSQEQVEALPRYLLTFVGFWLACGLITLVLHFWKGQKSLNSWSKQISNVIFMLMDFLLVPIFLVIVGMGRQLFAQVEPYSGQVSDLFRFFTQSFGVLFDPILVGALVVFCFLLPFQAAWRYLKLYRLRGLPHMVFDVGFGIYLACAALLSMLSGNLKWYALAPVGVVLLCIAQTGGYLSDARDRRAAVTGSEADRAPEKTKSNIKTE